MKPIQITITLLALFNHSVALASDSVTAANIEDIGAFDQALAAQQKSGADNKESKSNDQNKDLGEAVSSRAKDLSKQAQAAQFKNYGQSVADQRRNNNGHALAAGGNSADKSTPGQGNGKGGSANSASNKPKRRQSPKQSQ